jgi:hypothetical protein
VQFPAVYEEGALRLVHHSTETLEQLTSRVLGHFTQNFVVVRLRGFAEIHVGVDKKVCSILIGDGVIDL